MNDLVTASSTPPPPARPARTAWAVALLLGLLALAALALAWDTRQRLLAMEQELVRRQQDSQTQAAEARMLARQAEDAARQAAAKVALVDARVTEATVQRSQVEELLASLTRSHDDGELAQVDALIRSAQQQSTITGSAEPLLVALRLADERLARRSEPKLERVRRAVQRDTDRLRAASATDPATLTAQIDDVLRSADELPLRAQPRAGAAADAARAAASMDPARAAASMDPARAAASMGPTRAAASAPPPAAPPRDDAPWRDRASAWWDDTRTRAWDEMRALVRVTRIESPEAALLSPEQGSLLRQNLKLRLLNARLALLARQYTTVQTDLREAQALLERYYDRDARRVTAAIDQLRQVALHARAVTLPRPDETLAALAAAAR